VVLRCPEIEGDSQQDHPNAVKGVSMFNPASKPAMSCVANLQRPCRHIKALSRMTLSFENLDGKLCDFYGTNNTMLLGIHTLFSDDSKKRQ
jgi:hypothetical protein